jgi:hypothetical protein
MSTSGRQSITHDDGPPHPERDLPLTEGDIDVLTNELSKVFSTADRATSLLRNVKFPAALVPEWHNAYDFWATIFHELDNGAMEAPYRRLVTMALRRYGQNETLKNLLDGQRPPAPADGPATAPGGEDSLPPAGLEQKPTCHLVVHVSSDEERTAIQAWLSAQQFAPEEKWVTSSAVSFRLNEADSNVVTRLMRTRPDIGWTLVPPGEPDYLLRHLFVEGPDGRSFRFSDVPASSSISSVATELVDRYPAKLPGRGQPTVVDHVGPDGTGRRVNPDSTLHQEQVREGSRLRVGFQRRAAVVNPLDRRDALFGVRNQLQQYVDTDPAFRVWSNSPALPTEYDIEFTQPGFGPPASRGEQPPVIDVHKLSIVLGPDFPITAPAVRWLTEVFHPNVFPTYDCDMLREREYMRGLVCLGTLAEEYQPSLNFGELCATLRDIAGYRNYSVFVPAGDEVDPRTGQPVLRGDYYDLAAAQWAISAEGQERIRVIGGAAVLRLGAASPARYGFEIEPD